LSAAAALVFEELRQSGLTVVQCIEELQRRGLLPPR